MQTHAASEVLDVEVLTYEWHETILMQDSKFSYNIPPFQLNL